MEPLKNMFSRELLARFAADVAAVRSEFPVDHFIRQVFNSGWELLELKQRVRHISMCLRQTLPPDYRAFLDLFGVDIPTLKFLNSFGFFVAIAFVAAHYTLAAELRRKNFITSFPHQTPVIMAYDAGDFNASLDAALKAIDYAGFPARREKAKKDGKLRMLYEAAPLAMVAKHGLRILPALVGRDWFRTLLWASSAAGD